MGSFINRLFPRLAFLKFRFDRFRASLRYDPDALARESFAQEGEDLLLNELMGWRKTGSFVDVGAHHPVRLSNTYYYYLRGWRGLNIDAAPGSMIPFQKLRPDDINIECAIGEQEGCLEFIEMSESGMSTFDRDLAEKFVHTYGVRVVGRKNIEMKRLETVLDTYWPPGKPIDFMTVDVEGFDLQVLRSNNWEKYRPEFLLVECLETEFERIADSPVCQFLSERGYKITTKGFRTHIFKRL